MKFSLGLSAIVILAFFSSITSYSADASIRLSIKGSDQGLSDVGAVTTTTGGYASFVSANEKLVGKTTPEYLDTPTTSYTLRVYQHTNGKLAVEFGAEFVAAIMRFEPDSSALETRGQEIGFDDKHHYIHEIHFGAQETHIRFYETNGLPLPPSFQKFAADGEGIEEFTKALNQIIAICGNNFEFLGGSGTSPANLANSDDEESSKRKLQAYSDNMMGALFEESIDRKYFANLGMFIEKHSKDDDRWMPIIFFSKPCGQ